MELSGDVPNLVYAVLGFSVAVVLMAVWNAMYWRYRIRAVVAAVIGLGILPWYALQIADRWELVVNAEQVCRTTRNLIGSVLDVECVDRDQVLTIRFANVDGGVRGSHSIVGVEFAGRMLRLYEESPPRAARLAEQLAAELGVEVQPLWSAGP